MFVVSIPLFISRARGTVPQVAFFLLVSWSDFREVPPMAMFKRSFVDVQHKQTSLI